MIFTVSWRQDHLDVTSSLAEIVGTLTRIGLAVEGDKDPRARYKSFVACSGRSRATVRTGESPLWGGQRAHCSARIAAEVERSGPPLAPPRAAVNLGAP